MKKIIVLIVTSCLIGAAVFVLATWDKSEEADLSSKIEQKIVAYRTDLQDSASTLTSTDAIKKYFCNWAESKGIAYETDAHDNVILEVPAGEGYENASPSVILCGYDSEHFANCIDPISVALYVAKNNEGTGKLTVIFTEDKNHSFSGIQGLDQKYFPNDANVFNLNGGTKNMWSTTTAGNGCYTFSGTVDRTKPKGSQAYRISITGLPGGVPNEKIASYPNPIKELSDLLAYFKTNSVIFELAKMTGGTNGSLYPKSAGCTIVIDENDHDKFEKRITTAIENFNEKYEGYGAVYSYKKVKTPDTVLTSADMNKLVSFLYTMVDGVYERDEEDEILSITNIGAIQCTGSSCTVFASGNSMTKTGLNQIDLSYTTVCGLANVKYKKTSSIDSWSVHKPDEDPFVQNVADAFQEYSEGTMKYRDSIAVTNCSYVYEKNPECNLMNITVNWKRIEKYAGTLITFLLNQNQAG